MRPVIGIMCSYDVKRERFFQTRYYVQAVLAAGGIPLLLPVVKDECAEDYVSLVDGILFSGGGDFDSYYFGEEPHPKSGEMDPERDHFEWELAKLVLRTRLPALGICRGMQLLNIAAGGTLFQDIPSQVPGVIMHWQKAPRWYPIHAIEIQEGSRLKDWLGGSIRVNSYHHQAVKQLAGIFQVTARSVDGIIEALEAREYPFLIGVQWHPECMVGRYQHADRLFEVFVEAAKKGKRRG